MSKKFLHRTKENPWHWKDGDLPSDPADLRTYEFLTWEDVAKALDARYPRCSLKGITVEDGGIELAFED